MTAGSPITVEEHLSAILAAITPLSPANAELADAEGCVLAEDVTAALEGTTKGRAIVVPGALYKSASWAVNVTPRWI